MIIRPERNKGQTHIELDSGTENSNFRSDRNR